MAHFASKNNIGHRKEVGASTGHAFPSNGNGEFLGEWFVFINLVNICNVIVNRTSTNIMNWTITNKNRFQPIMWNLYCNTLTKITLLTTSTKLKLLHDVALDFNEAAKGISELGPYLALLSPFWGSTPFGTNSQSCYEILPSQSTTAQNRMIFLYMLGPK